jgi:coenzyme F420-0:L-glutamate ligase/coenzyme F420-1:gamma-L-glutamate ligase
MSDEFAPQELHRFLRSRRSVRRFRPDHLPASVIERLLETAIRAPSAHNLQPWRFVVLQNAEARTRLGEALTDKMRTDMTAEGAPNDEIEARVTRSQRRLEQAPSAILFCCDVGAVRKDDPEEHAMAMQSVAAAGLQLMLAAHAEGLGSNWICWPLYAPETTRAALSLPETWQPQALFFIGYPDEVPQAKKLKPLEEISRFL